jgi:hypothetical protein
MMNYLSFHNPSFALKYFLMGMARPQCDSPCLDSKHKTLLFGQNWNIELIIFVSQGGDHISISHINLMYGH